MSIYKELKYEFFKKKKDKQENNFDNFPSIGGLMVSKMVVDEKIKPRFMYREKRTRREDSGWRIFTGFESEEYSDDPNNTGIYNPVISKNNFSPSEYTVLRDYLREHDIHSFLRWNDIIPLLQNKSSWKEVTKNKKAQIIKNPYIIIKGISFSIFYSCSYTYLK